MNVYPVHSGQPSWSNNSKTIVTSTGSSYFDIQTIPASGGSHTLLADVIMNNDYDPSYSKNGRLVAFSASKWVEEESIISNNFSSTKSLVGNFPNPFSYSTNIQFNLKTTNNIQINIYNQIGQKVKTLANGNYSAGIHQVTWNGDAQDGSALPAGLYIYRIAGDGILETDQMILLRN